MPVRKIAIAVATLLAVLGWAQHLEAATLTLAWDHSPDDHAAGYLISYGTQSGRYTGNVKTGYVTTASLTGLSDGARYYFVVQSFDSAGALGPLSPEVAAYAGSTPVTVACPSPVLTSPDGKPTAVTLTPTVTGGTPPITSTCSPPSGSIFAVGSTSFTCTATDALQRKAACTSAVVVMAPSLAPPPSTTSPSGTAVPPASRIIDAQLVTWTLGAAISGAPGNFEILRNAQPQGDYAASLLWYGGQMYAGVTDGHWYKWTSGGFVDVGTTKPGGPASPPPPSSPPPAPALTLACPQIAPVTATSNSGMSVTFANPVFSGGTAPVAISCTPKSGSQFAIGTTAVSCQADDALGKTASCTTAVMVLAPVPAPVPPLPVPAPAPPAPAFTLTCPVIAPVTVNGNSGRVRVNFASPVVSGGKAPVAVTCSPGSNSRFSVGTTAVSCQGTDATGQTASCSTSVTVR